MSVKEACRPARDLRPRGIQSPCSRLESVARRSVRADAQLCNAAYNSSARHPNTAPMRYPNPLAVGRQLVGCRTAALPHEGSSKGPVLAQGKVPDAQFHEILSRL